MDNNEVIPIPFQLDTKESWPRYRFRVCVHCDLDLGVITLGRGPPLSHGLQLCDILSRSNMAVKSYGPDMDFVYKCTITLVLEIESRSWHTLWSWTTIVWNIIKIQHGSEELWPGHEFLGMCALWPWPWRYDLGSKSWHTLRSWTKIVRNII